MNKILKPILEEQLRAYRKAVVLRVIHERELATIPADDETGYQLAKGILDRSRETEQQMFDKMIHLACS